MLTEAALSDFLKTYGYISIQMSNNALGHFEAHASINGVESLLLVDTGAARTVIARDRAAKYSLELIESEETAGGLGTTAHQFYTGTVDALIVDSININSMPVWVMDLEHVNKALEARGGRVVDGLIGGDLLGSKHAIIDYRNSILYLHHA